MPGSGFTDEALDALRTAQEIVQQNHSAQLDVEHIMLALLQSKGGQVARLLTTLGGDPAGLAEQLDQLIRQQTNHATNFAIAQIHITIRAQRVVAGAAEQAAQLSDAYIGPAHLLIAIARDSGGQAAQLLGTQGITADRIAEAIQATRSSGVIRQNGDSLQLTVRLTSSDFAALRVQAEQAGLTPSEWLAQLVLRELSGADETPSG